MDDIIAHLTRLNQQHGNWLTWGGLLLLILCVVVLLYPAILQKWKEWRMARCIRQTGEDTLTDVFLSDGVEGVHYFPFIVLTRKAIVFFKTLQFRGIIFAADTIDFWTQVVGKRSYKFHNPLPGLEAETASIKALNKKAQVEGRVIFTTGSHFPKGRPQAVMLESEVKGYLQNMMQGEISSVLRETWAQLKQVTAESSQDKQDRLLMSKPRVLSNGRIRLVWVTIFLAIVWLVWRLI
jgi:hypothetical protein